MLRSPSIDRLRATVAIRGLDKADDKIRKRFRNFIASHTYPQCERDVHRHTIRWNGYLIQTCAHAGPFISVGEWWLRVIYWNCHTHTYTNTHTRIHTARSVNYGYTCFRNLLLKLTKVNFGASMQYFSRDETRILPRVYLLWIIICYFSDLIIMRIYLYDHRFQFISQFSSLESGSKIIRSDRSRFENCKYSA